MLVRRSGAGPRPTGVEPVTKEEVVAAAANTEQLGT